MWYFKFRNARKFVLPLLSIVAVGLFFNAEGQAGPRDVNADLLVKEFQKALEQVVEETGAPGGVAAFTLPDGRTFTVSAGFADKERGILMAPNSRLLSASIGKSFVGATALSLAADGKIDLDAKVSTWLSDRPWFSRLPNANEITLRNLLDHRAGLLDHVYMPEFAKAISSGKINLAIAESPEKLIEFILDKEPLFPAGKGFKYTDSGFLIAGLAIEAATGKTYYGELRRRILDPLGLMLTSPSDHPHLPGLVPGYLPADNPFGLPEKILENHVVTFNPGREWTGGGLVTNAGDLARYAKELYEGRVIKGEFSKQLLAVKPRSKDQPYAYPGYGLGQGAKMTDYGLAYGHNGWIPGYTSFMAYFPDYGISVAAQFNMVPVSGKPAPVTVAKERLPAVVINSLKNK